MKLLRGSSPPPDMETAISSDIQIACLLCCGDTVDDRGKVCKRCKGSGTE